MPDQQKQLERTVHQFWQTTDQMFALARAGKKKEAVSSLQKYKELVKGDGMKTEADSIIRSLQ